MSYSQAFFENLFKMCCFSRRPSYAAHYHPRYTRAPAAIIHDNFTRLSEVSAALAAAGLESSNLLVAIDFTKSNEWTGRRSHGGTSLHASSPTGSPPPYASALGVVARTLARFDDDGLIPAYGFGCARTCDTSLFSFLQDDIPCDGLSALVARYSALAPHVRLAGPTSFAPAIRKGIEIVSETKQYHILVIIADGQVTRSIDAEPGDLSPQERATIDAIVDASEYPLSIVIIGVGDGPWDMMREFDDELPARRFDNLQFVAFNETVTAARALAPAAEPARTEFIDAYFATRALMEIPDQYRAIQREGLLSARAAQRQPPPRQPFINILSPPHLPSSSPSIASMNTTLPPVASAPPLPPQPPPPPASTECTLCNDRAVDCVLGCGHPYCKVCVDAWRASRGVASAVCPRCRVAITRVTPLFV